MVEQFPLRSGGTTPLREGCSTCNFGLWKINNKHNLYNLNIIAYTVLYGYRANPSPGVYEYLQAFSNVYSSSLQINLLVVSNQNAGFDPRILGLEVGIVTAYCVGVTECPMWVNVVGLRPIATLTSVFSYVNESDWD